MSLTAVLTPNVVIKTAVIMFLGYLFLLRPLLASLKKVRDRVVSSGAQAAELRRQQHLQRVREQQERIREAQAQEEERRLARNARQRERRAAQRARRAQEAEAVQEKKSRKVEAVPAPKPSSGGPKSWLDRLVEDDDTE